MGVELLASPSTGATCYGHALACVLSYRRGWAMRDITPQCYGCTKTLASHEHVHHHLIHKHHTLISVIISCLFLYALLGYMLVCVYAHV
jgi:hypothetical protein